MKLRGTIGCEFDWQFSVMLDDGVTAEDLTGAEVYFTIKEDPTDSDPQAAVQVSTHTPNPGIAILNPASNGRGVITIPPAKTSGLIAEKTYSWDLKVIESSGAPFTPLSGTVTFAPGITGASS